PAFAGIKGSEHHRCRLIRGTQALRFNDVETVASEQKRSAGGAQTCARGVFVALDSIGDTETADRARLRIEQAETEIGAEPDAARESLEQAVDCGIGQSAAHAVTPELRAMRVDAFQLADAGERANPYSPLIVDQQAGHRISRQGMSVAGNFTEGANLSTGRVDHGYAIGRAGPDVACMILRECDDAVAGEAKLVVEAMYHLPVVVMDQSGIVGCDPKVAVAGAKQCPHRRGRRLPGKLCIRSRSGTRIQLQNAVVGRQQ